MPWFPDFVGAVELARRQDRSDGQADAVTQYFSALEKGDADVLEATWSGEVVIYDPRAGEIRGHDQLHRFVSQNQTWRAEHHVSIETVASTSASGRSVVELLAHIAVDGKEVPWPIAVVAEPLEDGTVVFRTYCSQWPVDGRRHLRPPILTPGPTRPGDVVGRYLAALDAGDAKTIVGTFASDAYFREAIGQQYLHRGRDELTSFFSMCFSAGGGISLQDCAVTDDGVRCALEYNCVRWGRYDLPAQAGIAVFERGADGLLTAARVYDDVEAPFDRS